MNTSKLFLLLDYLNEAGMINSVSRALRKEFTIEDTLESKLWNHIKKYIKSKQKNYEKLDKTYILINIFNNDIKSLNRTHSRLYKRIKSILVYNYINNKPIIEDWLFRETIKKEPNRLVQLISDNFIADKYEINTSFEKDLNSYIQFHVTYEKYLEESLKNSTDISLFVGARQALEDYYLKYHSILETERLQRSKINKNENIEALKSPMLDKNQSLLESELLLQKVNALDENPYYFDFCLNWFTHVVEENLISKEMQKTIFPILYNFAYRNYNESGNLLFNEYSDRIIFIALDKKVLYTDGTLSAYIYVALLSNIAVDVNKTQNYIDKYLKEVTPVDYSKAKFISNLYSAFYSSDFEKVLNIINKNNDNVSLGFDTSLRSAVRMFLLRSYFELKDEENFLRQCVGAKKYYKSQNLSKTKEAYFFDAIDIMKDLFFVNNPNKLLKIEDKIQQNEIAVKRWLLKKIKESPFYSKSELLKTK